MPPKKNKNNPQQPIDPYQQRLDKEKARVQREIEAWAKKQREEIVDHVHEQNTTLDDILKALKANYNPSNQVKSPEQSGDPKRNNVSNNLASQDQGNYHEFPELGVTHYDRTIEFIQVMFEPCNNQQQENTNTSSTRNHHQPQIGPSQQSANSPTNGATLSAESAARLRRRRQASTNNQQQTTTGGSTSRDNFLEHCPTCYMIFPSHLDRYERNEHMGKH